jgi:hypothetical protein
MASTPSSNLACALSRRPTHGRWTEPVLVAGEGAVPEAVASAECEQPVATTTEVAKAPSRSTASRPGDPSGGTARALAARAGVVSAAASSLNSTERRV